MYSSYGLTFQTNHQKADSELCEPLCDSQQLQFGLRLPLDTYEGQARSKSLVFPPSRAWTRMTGMVCKLRARHDVQFKATVDPCISSHRAARSCSLHTSMRLTSDSCWARRHAAGEPDGARDAFVYGGDAKHDIAAGGREEGPRGGCAKRAGTADVPRTCSSATPCTAAFQVAPPAAQAVLHLFSAAGSTVTMHMATTTQQFCCPVSGRWPGKAREHRAGARRTRHASAVLGRADYRPGLLHRQ